MGKICTRLVLMTLVFCFFITSVPFVLAQDDGGDEFMLEEITVTAQKREENQQKVAIAMDVVSAEEIREKGMSNVDDILSNVSNVFINRSADGMRISLRGLTDNEQLNMSNQHTSTPTVAVNIDGAFNSNSNAGQNLFDVERVEVLFGPQSTLYSSNSPGGIVNVVTASPKTDRYAVNGTVKYGNYSYLNIDAAVNVPVVQDKFAMRAAVSYTNRDSYIEGSDSTTAEDTKSARLKALYEPSENLSFTVTGNLNKRGGGGGMGGGVVAFEYQDDVDDPWISSGSDSMGGGNAADEDAKGISGEIAWDSSVGALTIVPSYATSDSESTETSEIMDSPGEYETSNNVSENTQKSIEARLSSSPDFFFKWIVGANYYESYDERLKDYEDEDTIDTHSINTTESKALYGNITYPVTETFRATAGYRRSWDETENNSVESNGPGGVSDGTPTISTQEYSNPDYKIGIEYDLRDNVMVYADRSTSFRINGMGMVREGDVLPDPEELVSYTAGAKTRFLDNKLQLNLSAFFYDYKNKQANQDKVAYGVNEADYGLDFNNNGTTDDEDIDVHDRNAQGYGDFETYGLDIQTNYIITSKDKLNLSVSYLHSKWTELLFDYEWDVLFKPEDFSGMENIFSPTWTITSSYDHNFTLWNGGILTGHVDGLYKSDFRLSWADEYDDNGVLQLYNIQEAYFQWNASLRYNNPGSQWSVSTYVKNITDYAVKTMYQNQQSPDGTYSAGTLMIGDPRTFGVVVSFSF